MSRVFSKDPDATLDYAVDWSRWLNGDEIATSEWELSEGALLEIASSTFTTTKGTVWLRGGQAGTSYLVTNRITTTGGRTDDRTITVQVEER